MFSSLTQLCTATAPGSEKHCTMMAKTAPYPPCTGTVIWLACRRVPGLLPDAASGNAYYHNRRAVRRQSCPRHVTQEYLSNHEKLNPFTLIVYQDSLTLTRQFQFIYLDLILRRLTLIQPDHFDNSTIIK